MRMKGTKGKREKSETNSNHSNSDGESVASNKMSDNEEESTGVEQPQQQENDGAGEDAPTEMTPPKKSAKKRSSRASRGGGKKDSKDKPEEDGQESGTKESNEVEEEQHENGVESNKSGAKRRKKQKAEKKKEPEEYEVEKVVGQRTLKGRQQFQIRWKGYGEDDDTWEDKDSLNCSKLIEDFLASSKEETDTKSSKSKTKKSDKKSPNKVEKKGRGKPSSGKADQNGKEDDEETTEEYEVEKIIDVFFKKNNSREFLIRWKGFSARQDTWEPEAHLNCPELINKFMEKVDKAKNADTKELRANRPRTQRFTLSTQDHGRRLSKRHSGKQRTTYHDCEV